MGLPMRLVARIEPIAVRIYEVSYNVEPDVTVFVGSAPISGERCFSNEMQALAWIKETARAFGVEKEKVWIEVTCG
jgi:hypothetical protein